MQNKTDENKMDERNEMEEIKMYGRDGRTVFYK